MEHSFDIDVASDYGIPCAILLKHIFYWTEKNRANEKHCIDGEYWTYCSVKAFNELFPYMSAKTIRSALIKLEDNGIIRTGCFNVQNYDRTKWYSLTEKGKSLCQKSKFDFTKRANRDDQKGEPIPNSYTDTKTDIKSSKEDYKGDSVEPPSKRANGYGEIISMWNSLSDCGIPQIRDISQNSNRLSMLKTRLRQYGDGSFAEVVENIRHSDFLQGKIGNRPFIATFDWVIRPNNYPKVLEGNYDNRKRKGNDRMDMVDQWARNAEQNNLFGFFGDTQGIESGVSE